MAKEIPLVGSKGKGRVVIVDDDDYAELSKYEWRVNTQGYVYRTVIMHRALINAASDKVVDHINGNRLDNRKTNLRECTHRENVRNAAKGKGTSKYKGVGYVRQERKWRASIMVDKKSTFLGYFQDEIAAALKYDQAARYYFGEFARLNFPDVVQPPFNPVSRIRTKTSKYRGVHKQTRTRRFLACIRVNHQIITIGSFLSEEDAARAYDKVAREKRGDKARLNFPDQTP